MFWVPASVGPQPLPKLGPSPCPRWTPVPAPDGPLPSPLLDPSPYPRWTSAPAPTGAPGDLWRSSSVVSNVHQRAFGWSFARVS